VKVSIGVFLILLFSGDRIPYVEYTTDETETWWV